MPKDTRDRRAFVKTVGLSAAALSAQQSVPAAEVAKKNHPLPRKCSRLDGFSVDVLAVGGVAAWCLGMPINQMRPACRTATAKIKTSCGENELQGEQPYVTKPRE